MSAPEITYPRFPLRRFIREITDGPFGSSLASSHYAAEGARVIRLGNVGAARFKEGDAAYISLEYFKELRQYEVKSGDLIIAGLGDSNHPVGRACVAPPGLGPAIVKADCFRTRLDEERLSHRYAAWALSSSFVSGQVHTLTRGSTRARINLDVAREIQLPVPPAEEQHRIADFLDAETARIHEISKAHSNQVTLLTERHRSWLSELSTELTQKYGSVRLRHVLVGIEQGWSPQCEERLAGEGEWGVIKAGCVNGGIFDSLQHKRLPPSIEPRREYQIKPGDLLMSRASGSTDLIGSTGIVPDIDQQLLLCDKIYRLHVNKARGRTEFIAHMLRTHSVREHLKLGISGAAGMANNLPTPVVKDCVLPDVPLAEQDSAIAQLTHMGELLSQTQSALERQITRLAERRQALITAAVTGQFNVSSASGRGVDTP
ncbi:restriction endonuclease subunit S [Streptomyces sp. WZ-12]|uniref:restriction endonuclease subunit S n=1 Tax=Streptomyces sp. WZ-12 TaxID=3030210 RepID=UPI0023815FEE|nr:restriction endonuclease subunit S [Streptomyces sp. WZ-12]